MGTFSHVGALDPGGNYTMLATVTVPERIFGPFVIRVNTDSRNQVYEHANENDNFASSPVRNMIDVMSNELVLLNYVECSDSKSQT